jgi:hypothetical protein
MAERCVNAEYKLKFDPRRQDQQNINDNIVQHLWSSFNKMCQKAVMFTGFPKTIKDVVHNFTNSFKIFLQYIVGNGIF